MESHIEWYLLIAIAAGSVALFCAIYFAFVELKPYAVIIAAIALGLGALLIGLPQNVLMAILLSVGSMVLAFAALCAVVFLFIVLTSTTSYAFWMMIALLVTGAFSVFTPDLTLLVHIGAWIICLVFCAYFWAKRKLYISAIINKDSLIGQTGSIIFEVSQVNKGIVVLQLPVTGKTKWACSSRSHLKIQTGVIVKQVCDDGTLLVEKHETLSSDKEIIPQN